MRLPKLLCLLASTGLSTAARWNRRQASSQDTCTCPSGGPRTSTYVSYTVVTSSLTVASFAGLVTETAAASTFVATVNAPVTVTFDAGTETVFIAGATVTTDQPITFTTTVYVSTVTTCRPTAYKHKRQASSSPTTTSTASSGSTFTATGQPALTFVTDFHLQEPSAALHTYVTVTSTPISAATSFSSDTVTVTVSELARFTRDFTQTVQPISTVTETATATVNVCPSPTASCNNQGIKWAAYNNTNAQGAYNKNTNPGVRTDNTYSSFDPTIFKGRVPVYQSTSEALGGFTDPSTTVHQTRIYGSSVTFTSDYLAIDHIGYLFAQLSGTYSFSVSQADDIAILWVGQNAVSGWTRANANLIDYYEKANAVYSISLFAGNYYPFRIFYANGQGGSQFTASITAPDGTVILNSNSRASPYLVQFSCDGVAAPPFPAFGSET